MHRLERLREVVDDILRRQPDEVERRCGFVHLYGVAIVAALLALKRGMDPEIATTAGMLHDISSYKTADPTNHADLSAVEAKRILKELGNFTEDEIVAICCAISNHSDKQGTHSDFCELLKDADVLQHHLYNTSLPPHEKYIERLKSLRKELGLS
jgi:uncharacterized protein